MLIVANSFFMFSGIGSALTPANSPFGQNVDSVTGDAHLVARDNLNLEKEKYAVACFRMQLRRD